MPVEIRLRSLYLEKLYPAHLAEKDRNETTQTENRRQTEMDQMWVVNQRASFPAGPTVGGFHYNYKH